MELVKKRQSVRNYLPDIVPREAIERCLEATRLAPSASNSQPWRFIVVESPELKTKLAEAAFSGIYFISAFAKTAPVLIAAVRKPSGYLARMGGFFRGLQYNLIDIGIACEHLVMQATEEGLGTCWIGWFNEKKSKKVLNLSKASRVDIIISMGYASSKETRNKIRKPLDEIRIYK
ncbi:MAG: nitroreductase family protein [Planctomycetes bacterium]|nr:nitroreductase family protein [Planctomycetota bacterium]